MIVVTGAAGFIASCLVQKLNSKGLTDLILVDDFSIENKKRNWENKKYKALVNRDDFESWLAKNDDEVSAIYHLGARTDTTEFNVSIFDKLNVNYSKMIWDFCVKNNVPLIYASSGATYGDGELGFEDSHDIVKDLKPLNPYGKSKNDFDIWVLEQENQPPFWSGVKFFNVYGPNEFHKGRMASVIFHAFNQITETGGMKLFRSHNEKYRDGEQLRDFIYVKDLCDMLLFLMDEKPNSGLYNIGTGNARTFLALTKATFKAMGVPENISFVDTPLDIRDKYQYFTEAKMSKLKNAGYKDSISSLEEGVVDYVQNYLMKNQTY